MGHLKHYCPKAAVEGRKWYPSPNGVGAGVDMHSDNAGGQMSSNRSGNEVCGAIREVALGSQPIGDMVLDDHNMVGTAQVWEVEGGDPSSPIRVKGMLKAHFSFWKDTVQASPFVLSVIQSGYVLPLKAEPTRFARKNQVSAMQNADFVQQCIDELSLTGCIKEVPTIPCVCSPLSVVVNSTGKKRLVVNLRHLNRFLCKQRFKYEDLRDDYLFAFDLKSGYHHVDIAQVHFKYLGIAWGGKFYVFTVLPFGLASACYLVTKLVRPLVRYWRSKGLRIIVYLDDGISAVAGEQAAMEGSQLVRSTLAKAGFVAHPTKSKWQPTRRLIWLGFVVDTALGQVEVPQDKLLALHGTLERATQSERIQARSLASIVGKIISMGLAFGPESRFMTHSLYAVLESRHAWCETLLLSGEASEELRFWAASLDDYNAQPIWHSPSAVRVVYSDASDTGYWGYVVEHGNCVSHGRWTAEAAERSSTWRELSAVWLVLLSVADKLANSRIRWYTDNQNVVRILEVGSKQPTLHAIALKVFALAIKHQIRLMPEWVPRELNERADYLSRIIDYDDWFLNPAVFAMLDREWGPHSVDRFADCNNCQVPHFNGRCWNPGSEAVDAFTVNWSGENNWWCPPIALIPRVIGHAQVCRAVGTLMVPYWPSALFWPLPHPCEEWFAYFVEGIRELPWCDGLTLPGLSGCNLFKEGRPNTKVIALRCNFARHMP